jgi:hypothetical protein
VVLSDTLVRQGIARPAPACMGLIGGLLRQAASTPTTAAARIRPTRPRRPARHGRAPVHRREETDSADRGGRDRRGSAAREQQTLLTGAGAARDARIPDVATVADAVNACAQGWARLPWAAVGEAGEAELADSTITVRCLTRPDGSLPDSDTEPDLLAYAARSY